MHIQSAFAETDPQVLHQLMREYPLGALVMQGPGGLDVNHMPFVLRGEQAEQGVLQGHLPRGNPIVQYPEQEAMVLFQGPQAYISPSWYPSKQQHGKAVPTWNYAVVHVYGVPRVIQDRAWLMSHLSELTDLHEARQALPWKVSDAPAHYLEQMLEHIVGVEIPITRLIGKFKLSQNRAEADRLGVKAGLQLQDSVLGKALLNLMHQTNNPKG